jgi:hypothetical protein
MTSSTSPASSASADSSDGAASDASPLYENETERAYDMARHSKTGRIRPPAFDRYWVKRNAPADKAYEVESNAFERALLKHVAGQREISVKKLVREYARKAALFEATTGEAPFK